MDNRRKHARFRTEIAAELDVEGEIFAGKTRDVSQGGASVLTDAQLIEGGSITMTLILTEDGIESATAEALCTKATVMWTAVTDAGLDQLKGLLSLRQIDLDDTKVTAAGIASLQAALPGVKIEGPSTP